MRNGKSRFAAAFEDQQVAEQTAAAMYAARRREAVPESRRAQRSDHTEPAELWVGRASVPVAVQNVSVSGASVLLADRAAPDVGQTISLRLCDGRHLNGRVVRVEQGCIGVMFDDELASVDDIVHLETRGADVYRGMARRVTQRVDS